MLWLLTTRRKKKENDHLGEEEGGKVKRGGLGQPREEREGSS